MIAIVAALLAAVLFGAGAALEQRQAATAPASLAGQPWLLIVLARRPLSRASWAAAAAVVVGVSAFTALTTPTGHSLSIGRSAHQSHGSPHQELVAVVVLGMAAVALAIAAMRSPEASATGLDGWGRAAVPGGTTGRRRATLLAVAASLSDTAMAVITLIFVHAIAHGPVAVVMSWPLYAVVVAGIGGILLTQTAYQAGHPLITLSLISAVTPAASVAIGWGVLGETVRLTPASELGAALAVLITSLALAALARSAPLVTSTLG